MARPNFGHNKLLKGRKGNYKARNERRPVKQLSKQKTIETVIALFSSKSGDKDSLWELTNGLLLQYESYGSTIYKMIIESAITCAWKTKIYASVVVSLNQRIEPKLNFKENILDEINQQINNLIKDVKLRNLKRLIRFISALVDVNFLDLKSLLKIYDDWIDEIEKDNIRIKKKSFLAIMILESMLFLNPSTLEENLEKLKDRIYKIINYKKKNYQILEDKIIRKNEEVGYEILPELCEIIREAYEKKEDFEKLIPSILKDKSDSQKINYEFKIIETITEEIDYGIDYYVDLAPQINLIIEELKDALNIKINEIPNRGSIKRYLLDMIYSEFFDFLYHNPPRLIEYYENINIPEEEAHLNTSNDFSNIENKIPIIVASFFSKLLSYEKTEYIPFYYISVSTLLARSHKLFNDIVIQVIRKILKNVLNYNIIQITKLAEWFGLYYITARISIKNFNRDLSELLISNELSDLEMIAYKHFIKTFLEEVSCQKAESLNIEEFPKCMVDLAANKTRPVSQYKIENLNVENQELERLYQLLEASNINLDMLETQIISFFPNESNLKRFSFFLDTLLMVSRYSFSLTITYLENYLPLIEKFLNEGGEEAITTFAYTISTIWACNINHLIHIFNFFIERSLIKYISLFNFFLDDLRSLSIPIEIRYSLLKWLVFVSNFSIYSLEKDNPDIPSNILMRDKYLLFICNELSKKSVGLSDPQSILLSLEFKYLINFLNNFSPYISKNQFDSIVKLLTDSPQFLIILLNEISYIFYLWPY